MWICEDCGSQFSEPENVRYCFEEYNGVESIFGSRTYGYFEACPYCGSEEIENTFEDYEDLIICE